MNDVVLWPAGAAVDQAAENAQQMHLARDAFMAAWVVWLRAGPSREDAEMEADGTAAVLRQLVALERRG